MSPAAGIRRTSMRLDTGMAPRARVRAPELVGAGGWLNTGGKDLTLVDLRGKIVILDFWKSYTM
ncbi:hypothetical protein [Kitasatospora sp. NBC_01266]|uniref:hypothetical protein n=1 Tax=Kitasatospora sp. NBC_01266 TaxID=2903572 RepID=UPI002E325637|nr:hypothetical protein [Kitasatospora sp. NBC_01266]